MSKLAALNPTKWNSFVYLYLLAFVVIFLIAQVLVRPDASFSKGYKEAKQATINGLPTPELQEAAAVVSEQLPQCYGIKFQETVTTDRFKGILNISHDGFRAQGQAAYRECFLRQLRAVRTTTDTSKLEQLITAVDGNQTRASR